MRIGLIQHFAAANLDSEDHHEIKSFRKAANFEPKTINVLEQLCIDNGYWHRKCSKNRHGFYLFM